MTLIHDYYFAVCCKTCIRKAYFDTRIVHALDGTALEATMRATDLGYIHVDTSTSPGTRIGVHGINKSNAIQWQLFAFVKVVYARVRVAREFNSYEPCLYGECF